MPTFLVSNLNFIGNPSILKSSLRDPLQMRLQNSLEMMNISFLLNWMWISPQMDVSKSLSLPHLPSTI